MKFNICAVVTLVFFLAAGCGESDDDVDYNPGELGPAGGYIFFVDDNNDHEFTYLEAAPTDVEFDDGQHVLHEWASGYADAFMIGATNTAIGAGAANTQTIVAALEEDEQTGRAAQVADEYEAGGYDDWFLPSRDELELMYEVLHEEGLGDFDSIDYWSSSETAMDRATGQNFGSGLQTAWLKTFRYRVRPVRAF